MKKIIKPQGTGWKPDPYDERDANWNKIFGAVAEAAPLIFTRPVPDYIPFQDGINCCVCATAAADQEYGSRMENHNVKLSFRYAYANTSGGTGGRSYREVAEWIQNQGMPEESYCPNDYTVGANKFLDVSFITQEGKDNAQKYRLKNYSFINTNLESLKSACYRKPIWIAVPGNNKDWSKNPSEIIKWTGLDPNNAEWYHSIMGWDWTDTYVGVLNWWNDRYRKLSLNYPIMAALSTEDLPDNWQLSNMLKIIGDKRDQRQYAVGTDGVLHWIFGQPGVDSEFLKELTASGQVDPNIIEWRDNLDGLVIGSPWASLK